MTEQKHRLYEGMYIFRGELHDEASLKALDKIKDGITQHGGEIVKTHNQGRKKLSYQIMKQREGHYFLIYFKLDPALIADLWQEYRMNENLLRFMTMRTDKVLDEIKFKQLPEQ